MMQTISVDWENLLSGDINQAWENWKQAFMSIMEQCVPHVTVKAKRNLPWTNIELTKSMRARYIAYRKAKRNNKPIRLLSRYRVPRAPGRPATSRGRIAANNARGEGLAARLVHGTISRQPLHVRTLVLALPCALIIRNII